MCYTIDKIKRAKSSERGNKMYIVKWRDYCGNEHTKTYKTAGRAIKKCFEVYGWYKNGECIRECDNTKIL